jgi:hypothetical protein
MPRFDFSLEDEFTVISSGNMECSDEDAARDCAVQILSVLFVKIHDHAPD